MRRDHSLGVGDLVAPQRVPFGAIQLLLQESELVDAPRLDQQGFEPSFDAPDGTTLVLPRQVRLGVASRPRGGPWVLAGDVDLTVADTLSSRSRELAAGVERWFRGGRLGVRGGVRLDTIDDARTAGAFGVSVPLSSVFLEFAGEVGGADAPESWGLSLRYGF